MPPVSVLYHVLYFYVACMSAILCLTVVVCLRNVCCILSVAGAADGNDLTAIS